MLELQPSAFRGWPDLIQLGAGNAGRCGDKRPCSASANSEEAIENRAESKDFICNGMEMGAWKDTRTVHSSCFASLWRRSESHWTLFVDELDKFLTLQRG